MEGLRRFLYRLVSLGVTDDLDDDEAMNRRIITGATAFQAMVAPSWAVLYAVFDEPLAAAVAASVTVTGILTMIGLRRFGHWVLFRRLNYAWWFIAAFGLMASLGGYALGSFVIIWLVFAPIMAILESRDREALGWSGLFVVSAIAAGVIQPLLRETNNIPEGVRTTFFVMSFVAPFILVFLLLAYFVHRKDMAMVVMRRNRELESAYLEQEISLRQSEKLATVGRLSAGLAHELNNPTAAAQQATRQLSSTFGDSARLQSEIEAMDLSEEEREALAPYAGLISDRARRPEFLDPLERSDREAQVQDFLERIGVDEPWDVAPPIVDLGVGVEELEELGTKVRADRLAAVATDVAVHFRRQTLLGGLDESMSRIIQLVSALKTYTHLDQADRQLIDLHEGLDSTLVMLQNRLKTGVVVNRSYGEDVPPIEANAGELNQVWTNLIDNAIYAMDGRGTIEITTRRLDDLVIVEITDDGPGVPDEIMGHLFDPFVTTKAPGEGTGLGLNISHNIITQKHGGEIDVSSRPGRTRFKVCLPIAGSAYPRTP